eukprot:gene30066-39927_t
MAALVAALVVEATDRTPWLIAIFADRFARRGVVIFASLCALATGFTIVALGGALIGERLTPEARQLFLAVALLNAGISAFFPIKPPNRLEGWRVGAAATSFFGVFILAFGGRTQFIVMALAERGPLPALAAIGATLGSVAIVVLAALSGEAARRSLPITGLRIVSGIALSTIGTNARSSRPVTEIVNSASPGGSVWAIGTLAQRTHPLSRERPMTTTAAPLKTPTDLKSNAVTSVADALNGILADSFALYLKTKNFHWHVSGPHFRDYHLLLDEQAAEIFAATDDIAERVRSDEFDLPPSR